MRTLIASVVLLLPCQALAYNRDVHQHLVELGYNYLKAIDTCDAEKSTCRDECEADLLIEPTGPALGYSCSCLYGACNAGCGALTGLDKFLCVEKCATTGAGAACTAASPAACPEPYYWEEFGPNISVAEYVCKRACTDAHPSVHTSCDALRPEDSGITLETARETLSFYRNVEATACPPGTYKMETQGGCAGSLVTDVRRLVDHEEAVWVKGGANVFGNYMPVSGGLLGDSNAKPDKLPGNELTGTIIGLHGANIDKLQDLYMRLNVLPLGMHALKTWLDIRSGVVGGVLAGAIAVAGVVGCLFACTILIFKGECDDCFKAVFDGVSDLFEKITSGGAKVQSVNATPRSSFAGHNLSSFFHFQRSSDFFDDLDGVLPSKAFGPGGAAAADLIRSLGGTLLDPRIDYTESKWSLESYQITTPDDDMSATAHRGSAYWAGLPMLDLHMPPIDNLSYFWWHKWFEGRIRHGGPTYGLMPLGGALHAVQDVTQPFHARGIVLQGHAPYETLISEHIDSHLGDPKVQRYYLHLEDPAEEHAFLLRVGQFIRDIDAEVRDASGVVDPRKLVHWLREKSAAAEYAMINSEEEGYLKVISVVDYDIAEEYSKKIGLPLAVAATVVILREGGRADIAPYLASLDVDTFDPVGGVPSEPAPSPGRQIGPAREDDPLANLAAEYPEWVCAGASARGAAAVQGYFGHPEAQSAVNGASVMSMMFAERARCQFAAQQMPIPPDDVLDAIGTYEADSLIATLKVLQHGNLAQMKRDLACVQVGATLPESLWSPQQLATLHATCDGTLDSDQDGVPDLTDQCATDPDLLATYDVGADGCVFGEQQ